MSTALFENIIFGPVSSRRLGVSLGVNLLPQHGKFCNFDCIYCECGWNNERRDDRTLPTAEQVEDALETVLRERHESGQPLDSITFSGNGEPTLHPDFPRIIDSVLALREKYFPNAKVSVLSNATMIHRPQIASALKKVDNPILKLDSSDSDMVKLVNNPQQSDYSIDRVIEGMKGFNGNFVLQSILFKGSGRDMLEDSLIEGWYDIVRQTRPREIMLYTIDRDTPEAGLTKISVQEMERVAAVLVKEGFTVQIRG